MPLPLIAGIDKLYHLSFLVNFIDIFNKQVWVGLILYLILCFVNFIDVYSCLYYSIPTACFGFSYFCLFLNVKA